MSQSFASDAEEDLVLRATTALFVPCPSKKMVGGSGCGVESFYRDAAVRAVVVAVCGGRREGMEVCFRY